MKINNEIDLLKLLIKNMNDKHRCNDKKVNIQQYLDASTLCNYLAKLKNAGYISVYIGGEFEIHDKGIAFLNTNKPTKKYISPIIKWFLGILTALITAYLIYELGLN